MHCTRQCEIEGGGRLRTEANLAGKDDDESEKVELCGDKTAIPRRRVVPVHTHMLM